jgi:hypothetical protein
VWTFNEDGVFLPILRRSALLFLRETLYRGAKYIKTRSFMPNVNTP